MPTTPTHALPYPAGSDTPDVPRDLRALAEATSRELTTVTSRSVVAGAGLVGGGSLAADRTINIGQGTGVVVSADSIAVDTAWGDGRYVAKAGATMTGALALPASNPTADTHAAHKGYVDSRIWTGTQAAYDAITTKDPAVLYVVI